MRRTTAFSTLTQSLRAALAATMASVTMVSCDTYTTSVMETPGGVRHVLVNTVGNNFAPAQKEAALAAEAAAGSFTRIVPVGPLANVVGSPTSAAASVAACGGGEGTFLGYTKDSVKFEPEETPNIAPYPLKDDGVIADVPLGFDFSFEGQTYNKINIYMNGFLSFGVATGSGTFYANTGSIADPALPNNIIALAWTDWQPNLAPNGDGLRYETRGTAPNRKFILQFNNVPEYKGTGRLLGQIVLYEGSNDITLYTTEMFTTYGDHKITQGIENADGTSASYDSVWNSYLNIQQARVKIPFALENDAIRFSLISSEDHEIPTITAPADDTVANDPGLASAFVNVGSPSTHDNCDNVTVTSTRSDGKAIDDPYPVGTTTITWTATDGAGNSASTSQTIVVLDKENPVWDPTFDGVFVKNATSPAGASVPFDNLPVKDNVGVTSISCEPASGSTFPIGQWPASCTAFDAAGNSASKAIVVVVVNAHDQIGNLIDWVRSLNLPDGTAQPLINQLLAAYDETADGSASCKKMYDFMTLAQKKDSNILGPDVQYMLDQGSRILNVMGCAPARNSVPVTSTHRGN